MTDSAPEAAVLAILDLCGELGGRQSGESHAVFLRRLIDALIAAEAGNKPAPPERWRHRKRGTTYIEIGRAKLQASDAGGLAEDQEMVVYRSESDGRMWCRPADEFDDGRFVRLEKQGGSV